MASFISDSKPTPLRHNLLQCAHCHVSKAEAELKQCQACHMSRYCSRKCQKADWPSHKKLCKHNVKTRNLMAEHAAATPATSSQGELSALEAQPLLKAWADKHRPLLSMGLIMALNLRADPRREVVRDNVLWLTVTYQPTAKHAAARFKVDHADVIPLAEVKDTMAIFGAMYRTLAEMNMESNTRGMIGYGMVAITHGTTAHTVPFGLPNDCLDGMVDPSGGKPWQDWLIEVINSGKGL